MTWQKRMQEIDRQIAERKATLRPPVKYDWEKQRDEKIALQKRVSALRAQNDKLRKRLQALGETPEELPLDIVLDQLGRYVPKRASEVHRDVSAVWGSVSLRTVQRALIKLAERGHAAATGPAHDIGWLFVAVREDGRGDD